MRSARCGRPRPTGKELDALLADPEMAEMAGGGGDGCSTTSGSPSLTSRCRSCCCRRTPPTRRARSSRSAPAPAATKAALFAGDLFRMYQRYADVHGWKVNVVEESPGEVGGYKEVVAEVNGRGVFARLKFEIRRPPRSARARHRRRAAASTPRPRRSPCCRRRSTSTSRSSPNDLKWDITRASSAGGQHANTTDTAVRIMHLADRHRGHSERAVAAAEPRHR